MKFMVYLLLAAVLCLSAVVGYQFDQIAQSRREARTRSLQTWHTVVCSIEAASIASPTVAASKKPVIVKFYDGLLVRIQAQPCGLKILK